LSLLVLHGLSGSGKSTIAQSLVETLTATIRVRADVERKRIHGLPASARTAAGIDEGIYGPEATARTYGRLLQLADSILGSGFTPMVEAAFLRRGEREAMRRLAERRGVPFLILDARAPDALLRERVARRAHEGRDPSEATLAVLERQLATHEPLDAG